MFLYTIVPPEELWDETPSEAEGAAVDWVETTHYGVPVLARRTSSRLLLERLLTTNPYLYLRPEFAPGTPVVSKE
ncbi:MAG TPA: hypothetical protein GXX28_06620 [Firmicutes bacterium]|nr:hypothetical protein [Bacillota bacterium]